MYVTRVANRVRNTRDLQGLEDTAFQVDPQVAMSSPQPFALHSTEWEVPYIILNRLDCGSVPHHQFNLNLLHVSLHNY